MQENSNVESLNKIDPESAEREFVNLCDAWDIDHQNPDLDDDEEKHFNALKRTIIRKIMSGHLSVQGDKVDFNLSHSETKSLKFSIPKGEALNKLDKYKSHEDMHQMNAYIGSMTGNPPSVISNLDNRDLKVATSLAKLFLAL